MSLALLAVFANPMVVVTAAVTVALHHLAFWAVLPESVFNYDAPVTSVLVHATFVVIESVAACFVARSFFDNVVGLERIVAARTSALDQRTRDLQLVLDNVGQGFLTAHVDGSLFGEHSAAIRTWLGVPVAGEPVWALFARANPRFASWLQLGWEALSDDVLPVELVIEQLPRRFQSGDRTFEVAYRPVIEDGVLNKVVVVVTDASERVALERADATQREVVAAFAKIHEDRVAFVEFFDESTARVGELAASPCRLGEEAVARAIHTLKGNAALFGLHSVAEACHAVETAAVEEGRGVRDEDRATVVNAWKASADRLIAFLGERHVARVEVEEQEIVEVLGRIRGGAPREEIAATVDRWRLEPAERRLKRMADQARTVATRLGLGVIEVAVDGGDVRLAREPLVGFWSSLVHVVRNAVDHGLRSVTDHERRLWISARPHGDAAVDVVIRDNGPGVDWAGVRARAQAMGLPSATREDLVRAMFHDGLTTRDEVTSVSGKGVGLAAVRTACDAVGASITVESTEGEGTAFVFTLPARLAA